MRNWILILGIGLWGTAWGQSVQVSRTTQGVKITSSYGCVELECFSPSAIHVKKAPTVQMLEKGSLSVTGKPEKTDFQLKREGNRTTVSTSQLCVSYDAGTDKVVFTDKNGKILLAEKAASAVFDAVDDAGRPSYRVKQTFVLDPDEAIFGLGQHQQGHFSQRGQTLHLQQANMEICIPLVHSIKGYALFWDNYSPTVFSDNAEGMTFDSEVGDLCDYYFVWGGGADGVIAEWRRLTGQAPLFPLWTFGFIQSRERYTGQDELLDVVRRYRDLQIPLDGIVQDWQYWGEDHANWNAVEFRNPRFPDPQRMMDEIHRLHAHAMISVWPSFGPATGIHADLKQAGKLLRHETFPQNFGVRVYEAYDPEARDIYWDYLNRNLFSIGMDSWWLDATEPEHSPAVKEDYDCQTAMGSFRRVRNAFPLVSVGGVYDHQRATTAEKRVCILTRSAFAGQQRYAAQSWSGDVVAGWDVLRNQIPAALNFSLCGIPYWNSDIGGFYSANNYPDGVKDPAYQELYVRWMQFAAFTGMMRSHGTNTPREIFQFGQRGDWAFDAQEEAITLRYRFLPYLYASAWQVTSAGASLMRPLFAGFPEDKRSAEVADEYLFGKSLLVAPVVSAARERTVYLPGAARWTDFWTGETHPGGEEIKAAAPINRIPLYVQAGSVLPMGPAVQYATEKPWDDLQIRIYPGANGELVLYEDENDNYNYEKGRYTTIRMTWDDNSRVLTLHERKGTFDSMLEKRRFRIVLVDKEKGTGLDNKAYDIAVEYTGESQRVQLP